MQMFELPKSTILKKVIPKKTFEAYLNTKQKKAFSEKILKITWANKLSKDTINLSGKDVEEIQFLEIDLKERVHIKDLLMIIDKAIPYHIIFKVKFNDEYYVSTSVKHIHPANDDNAVIDYTFSTDWINEIEVAPSIELKNSLDWIYKRFCLQFIDDTNSAVSLKEIVENEKKTDTIKKEIEKIKSEISRSKQFNKKVDLNIRLSHLQSLLKKS